MDWAFNHMIVVVSAMGGLAAVCVTAVIGVAVFGGNKVTPVNTLDTTQSSVSSSASMAAAVDATPTVAGGTTPQDNASSAPEPNNTSSQGEDAVYNYSLDRYLAPYWSTGTMYNEAVMFVQNKDGSIDPAPLLYTPDTILAVRSFDLTTEYKEGMDYTVEDGKIRLTSNTSIPYFLHDDYYPATYTAGHSFECTKGGYILYGEQGTFLSKQIAITYTHSDSWQGSIPETQANKLQRSIAKMKNKEPLTLAFYGDSITVGANSSGYVEINMAPRAPTWPQMVFKKLKAYFGDDNITYVNGAQGGANTQWGINNVRKITDKNPDLVVIGFGMNDAGLSLSVYQNQIQQIIDAIRAKNPDAEFVLVSTMLPNKEVAGFYGNQYTYEKALQNIADANNDVAYAPVTSMDQTLLLSKRCWDMTGNNVNHPNDFRARMYAQTVLKVMLGDY